MGLNTQLARTGLALIVASLGRRGVLALECAGSGGGGTCAIWEESFEGELDLKSKWEPVDEEIIPRFMVEKDVAAPDGTNVLKVAMQPGDKSGKGRTGGANERAEIQIREEVIMFDNPYWYRFSFKVNKGEYPMESSKQIVHQIRENVRDDAPCHAASPFFAFELKGEEAHLNAWFRVTASQDCNHDKPLRKDTPVSYGEWHDVQVHMLPSHTQGFATAWLDGKEAFHYEGLLGYSDYGKGFVDIQPRFGVYRDKIDGQSTLYLDDIVFWNEEPAADPRWKKVGDVQSMNKDLSAGLEGKGAGTGSRKGMDNKKQQSANMGADSESSGMMTEDESDGESDEYNESETMKGEAGNSGGGDGGGGEEDGTDGEDDGSDGEEEEEEEEVEYE